MAQNVRDPLRAPVRIGTFGDHAVGSEALQGAYGVAQNVRDPLRAPVRIGTFGEHAVGSEALQGAYGVAQNVRDPLRAPVRIGRLGEYAIGLDGTGGGDGAYVPAEDPLTHTLSTRPLALLALGHALGSIMTQVEGAGSVPESMPESLRTLAHNPEALARGVIDLGLVSEGGGVLAAGLSDWTELKTPHRVTDVRAMAVGDVGMALVSGLTDQGAYMPPELVDLEQTERDAATLALGRALLNMVDGAVVAGSAPTQPAESFEETRRAPAVQLALGQLALQLADDVGGAYVPPDDWAAAQSKDRVVSERALVSWAAALGSHFLDIVAPVEALHTGGLSEFEAPLRADSHQRRTIADGGAGGAGVMAGVEGSSTGGLTNAEGVRGRKLSQYAADISARLTNLNAHAEAEGFGTAGLAEQRKEGRARNDVVKYRGSNPSRVIAGSDGIFTDLEVWDRTGRARRDPGVNPNAASADGEGVLSSAATRAETWTRGGHKWSEAAISTPVDNYGSGGWDSALQREYTSTESDRYMEVEQ